MKISTVSEGEKKIKEGEVYKKQIGWSFKIHVFSGSLTTDLKAVMKDLSLTYLIIIKA